MTAACARLNQHVTERDVGVRVKLVGLDRLPVGALRLVPPLLICIDVAQTIVGAPVARLELQRALVGLFAFRVLARIARFVALVEQVFDALLQRAGDVPCPCVGCFSSPGSSV
jgi:hypothetical protein